MEANNNRSIVVAIEDGRFDIVAASLSCGTDPDTVDGNGVPLLTIAIEENVAPELIRLLLTYKADVNFQNHAGETPLHIAVDQSLQRYIFEVDDSLDLNCIKLLLEAGADINPRDLSGKTPRDWAVSGGPIAEPILVVLDEPRR